ncbi:unnamed protein product [Moneuplotes crassus]|uniref:Uncharacterized protein n=1 Tax=Euplotes crassus TaxID=5936 RepID=A0AAD1U9R5_EUPCR|nr:unnamed protein product [Moneuplotes crassus]
MATSPKPLHSNPSSQTPRQDPHLPPEIIKKYINESTIPNQKRTNKCRKRVQDFNISRRKHFSSVSPSQKYQKYCGKFTKMNSFAFSKNQPQILRRRVFSPTFKKIKNWRMLSAEAKNKGSNYKITWKVKQTSSERAKDKAKFITLSKKKIPTLTTSQTFDANKRAKRCKLNSTKISKKPIPTSPASPNTNMYKTFSNPSSPPPLPPPEHSLSPIIPPHHPLTSLHKTLHKFDRLHHKLKTLKSSPGVCHSSFILAKKLNQFRLKSPKQKILSASKFSEFF